MINILDIKATSDRKYIISEVQLQILAKFLDGLEVMQSIGCEDYILSFRNGFVSVHRTLLIKEKEDYMPYVDYLKTEHWSKVRKMMLNKSAYKCQLCSSKEKLNVHHNNYNHMWNETENDLIVLCEKCHKKFHNK